MDSINAFLNPVFEYLESGKLFRQPLAILYYLIGVAVCFYGIYRVIDFFSGYQFKYGGTEFKFFYILLAIVIIALCLFSIMFWFRRANMLKQERFEDTKFLAIPVVANLFRTIGEWLGVVTAVLLVWIGFLFIIFLAKYDMALSGLICMIAGPIIGYLTIVFFRYFAEAALAKAEIANNTRDTARALEH